MAFDIERQASDGAVRLAVRGALDALTGDRLERAVPREEAAQPQRLEIDLSALDVLDLVEVADRLTAAELR